MIQFITRMIRTVQETMAMATCLVCGGSGQTLMGKCNFCKNGQR